MIKSGGEWIGSIDLENIAAGPSQGVQIAAVVGIAARHAKWDERPLVLVVQLKPGADGSRSDEMLIAFYEGKIAKWWTPDDVVFIEAIPLGATGKIDKKLIRQQFEGYSFPTAQAAE